MPLSTMKRVIFAVSLCAGCASGRTADQPIDGDATPMIDGKVYIDARANPDAPSPPPDAQAAPDAYQCHVMTQQLLQNPVLDLSPVGMAWVQQNIDNSFPIVSNSGIVPQSAPYKAWMGGFAAFEKGALSVTDTLYQDVAIPAGTTQLLFTGYYLVGTAETSTSVHDTAQIGLIQTNGTPIETIRSFDNTSAIPLWTAMTYTVTSNLSGQTVRLRLTSTNDVLNVSSFYFDTLALTATYCQ